jgi:hypothetical protein
MGSAVVLLAVAIAAKRRAKRPPRKPEIRIEPGIDFEATRVVYRVTVRNRGDAAVRDVVITPRIVHGPFYLDEPPKAVPLLRPGEFGTASFAIGAEGEPRDLEVAARVSYWEREADVRHEASAPPIRLDLRPPATRPVHVDPAALRERASRFLSVQDAFPLSMEAERAFAAVASALAREGLEKVEETSRAVGGSFVGQASFHGLDRRGASYAVRAVASRRGTESSLRLHVFVEAEESLFGFYWRVREAVHRALAPHHP